MQLTQQLQNRFSETDVEQIRAEGTLVASSPEGRLTCEFADYEKIACELSQLRLESPRLERLDPAQSQKLAQQLVERLTYLLEPLSIVETDELSRTVQVRSTLPHRSDDQRVYYELLVEPGAVTFGRYSKDAKSDRQTTACRLTREVVLRICHDLESATSGLN